MSAFSTPHEPTQRPPLGTAPPYPTSTIGPCTIARTLAMEAESEVTPRSGLGGAVTV